MATDVEIERVLAVVTATLNDQKVDHFDAARIQEIVTASLGGEPQLKVDEGGGLHEESGARVAAIRRMPSGEWITERQNDTAEHSYTAIPSRPSEGAVRSMLRKLRPRR